MEARIVSPTGLPTASPHCVLTFLPPHSYRLPYLQRNRGKRARREQQQLNMAAAAAALADLGDTKANEYLMEIRKYQKA